MVDILDTPASVAGSVRKRRNSVATRTEGTGDCGADEFHATV